MAERLPGLVYHGRNKGFIKAEPRYESKSVDNRPHIPGADIVKLPSREIGVQSHPVLAAVVFPNGSILYSTGDKNILGKVQEPESAGDEAKSKFAKAKKIVEDALKRVDPKNPEVFAKPEPAKSSITGVKSNGHAMIVTIGNKKSA